MKKLTGYALALLLVTAVVGLLLESGSVHRIESGVVPVDQPHTISFPELPLPGTANPSSRLAVGARFASFNDLVDDQQSAGFVEVGPFGNVWPATVTEITTGSDEIKFARQNGTAHHYNKFYDYVMRMVRLMAGDKGTIVVFRSLNKG